MLGPTSSSGVDPPQPAVPVVGVPGGARAHEPEVHVLDRLHVFYRYRTATIAVTLFALAAGALQTYTTTPAYRSQTRVRAEPQLPQLSASAQTQPAQAVADPESFMQTELSVLRSRDLKRKVVRTLRLDQNRDFLTPAGPQGLDGSVAVLRDRLVQRFQSWLRLPSSAPPAAVPVVAASLEQTETPAETRAIERIAADLEVTPERASHLFTITFSTSTPQMAALVANALATEYRDQNLAARAAGVRDKLAKIAEFVQTLSAEIAADRQNGAPRQRLDANEKALAELQAQQKELEILERGIDNNVMIVEYAQPAARPYRPNAPRNLLISLAVGLALAVVLAFGRNYLDDTIQTPEDVTRRLHIPFLGLVPAVRGDRQPVLSGPVPHDFGEAYRALRTSLVFTSGGDTTRIITVTSAQPLEGKTTTACNLAMVLAFGGSRVLLIDADMRRPGVHTLLQMNNTIGLSHLLVGQARVREAIQRTSDHNLCVMTAGRTPPNPSELMASERMKKLVANLKQGPFDWVVIDTPPVLAVTDAVVLTPLVDGVTLVVGSEMTRRRPAERAVQLLMASRPKIVVGVLNRVNFDRNKYYYSRYYGHQPKGYYGAESPAAASSAKG